MTKGEAVNWIINLSADIGKIQHQDLWHYEQALAEIKEMLEAEPVQKTGKWIQAKDIPTEYAVCTNCKGHGEFYMNYCWHCGARMERGEE